MNDVNSAIPAETREWMQSVGMKRCKSPMTHYNRLGFYSEEYLMQTPLEKQRKLLGLHGMRPEETADNTPYQDLFEKCIEIQTEYLAEQTQHYAYWKRLKSMRPMSELT